MTLKSLFSVLTDADVTAEVMNHAEPLAAAFGAHLDVLCLGVDRSQAGYYYAGANAMVMQEALNMAEADTAAIRATLDARLAQASIGWGADTGVSHLADLNRHVANCACFSDLAVLPQPYIWDRGAEYQAVCEATLFEARTPALIVPPVAPPAPKPKQIMLCWNESPQALMAARAALPFVAAADLVHVVVVDPPSHGPTRSDPGGMISQYLARHGARVEIEVLSKTLPRISDCFMRHATDIEADMIVMGAYGHSRFRESVFGGATRDMLERAELPLLLAH